MAIILAYCDTASAGIDPFGQIKLIGDLPNLIQGNGIKDGAIFYFNSNRDLIQAAEDFGEPILNFKIGVF